MKGKWIAILVALLIVLGMYWTRYQVVELSGVAGFYRISRLTGRVELVAGSLTQRVRNVAESRFEIEHQRELREKSQMQQGQSGAPARPGAPGQQGAPATKD